MDYPHLNTSQPVTRPASHLPFLNIVIGFITFVQSPPQQKRNTHTYKISMKSQQQDVLRFLANKRPMEYSFALTSATQWKESVRAYLKTREARVPPCHHKHPPSRHESFRLRLVLRSEFLAVFSHPIWIAHGNTWFQCEYSLEPAKQRTPPTTSLSGKHIVKPRTHIGFCYVE